MTVADFIFYVLSAQVLVSAIAAVTTRKIFRSAIWLLFSLIGIAGLYFWMQMEFVAAVQIAVYAGGIVVLIIFSVFLTQQSGQEMPAPGRGRMLLALLAAVGGLSMTLVMISKSAFKPTTEPAVDNGVSSIGTQMLDITHFGYVFPFEVVSILLLAALVGCVVIAGK
jgi:NADH-quinone oxidoreductase subunit J